MPHDDPTIDLHAKLDAVLARLDAPPQPRRWFSIASSATYADLSQDSIRRLVSSGKLNAKRPVRGKLLIDKHELDALILNSTTTPKSGRGRPKAGTA